MQCRAGGYNRLRLTAGPLSLTPLRTGRAFFRDGCTRHTRPDCGRVRSRVSWPQAHPSCWNRWNGAAFTMPSSDVLRRTCWPVSTTPTTTAIAEALIKARLLTRLPGGRAAGRSATASCGSTSTCSRGSSASAAWGRCSAPWTPRPDRTSRSRCSPNGSSTMPACGPGSGSKPGSACRLQHERIVRTLALGETDDVFGEVDYVVMELFESIALHELVALHGPLDWPTACDIVCQAAEGLAVPASAGARASRRQAGQPAAQRSREK